jgi:hypothetical protein
MPYSISQQILTVLLDVVMDFNLKLDFSHYLVYLLIPAVNFFLVRSRLYLLPPFLFKNRHRY